MHQNRCAEEHLGYYLVHRQDKTMEQKQKKAPADTTVVVAMSGGVDSSVAAALLVEQGYNCIGVMMRLWAEMGEGEGSTNKCCSLESVHDARRVADQLGIPFYLINVERPFKQQVVDFFIAGYSAGVTPNPCIECNRHIRFDYLLNYARRLGADYLATGHYARLRHLPNGTVHLLKAVDEQKDQSYVLSVMGQAELRDVLFPVGDYPKPEIRKLAAARGLPIASKHDSMDLCFIFDDDYRRFLRDWAAEAMRPGPIVDRQGRVYGNHEGLPGYTIGQRKGLGISGASEPMYVLQLDHASNTLVVGTLDELGRTQLVATKVNWTLDTAPPSGYPAQCKIRYRAHALPCTLYPLAEDTVEVQFTQLLRDITPGQGAVFYDQDLCLGGGIITQ
ncbi:MAG: tRNA 2-thiouridine(34) synthase MnmA [Caldilineaceae bacterium]